MLWNQCSPAVLRYLFTNTLKNHLLILILQEVDSHDIDKSDDTGSKQSKAPLCSRITNYAPHILLFLGWFGCNSGHNAGIAFTPLRAKLLGIEKSKGALLVSIIGLARYGIVISAWLPKPSRFTFPPKNGKFGN